MLSDPFVTTTPPSPVSSNHGGNGPKLLQSQHSLIAKSVMTVPSMARSRSIAETQPASPAHTPDLLAPPDIMFGTLSLTDTPLATAPNSPRM